jgi:hypothetical protein
MSRLPQAACDSDSGGRNEIEFGRQPGSGVEWMAGVKALEIGRGEGGMLGETAVHLGYARAQALDWTHGCLRFLEWPLRRSAQIFQRNQEALL